MNAFFLLASLLTVAADAARLPAFSFLDLQRSPRAVGMGGAEAAAGENDFFAAFGNPASIGLHATSSFGIGAGNIGTDTPPLQFLSAVYRDRRFHNAWGLTAGLLNIASPGYDISGLRTGDAVERDMMAALHLAHNFSDSLAVGASLLSVQQTLNTKRINNLDELSYKAVMASFGAILRGTVPGLSLGAYVYNLGHDVEFGGHGSSSRHPLPTGLRLGAAWTPPAHSRLNFAADLDVPRYSPAAAVKLGAENKINGTIFLRGGLRLAKRTAAALGISPALGMQLKTGRLHFELGGDFDVQGLGPAFSMALTWRFTRSRIYTETPPAQEKRPVLAVMDLSPLGAVDIAVSSAASDLLRERLVRSEYFTVVDRKHLREILTAAGQQEAVCSNKDCAVKLGKLLGASKLALGNISQLNGVHFVHASIVDVEKGVIDSAESLQAENIDKLEGAMDLLAERLTEPFRRIR